MSGTFPLARRCRAGPHHLFDGGAMRQAVPALLVVASLTTFARASDVGEVRVGMETRLAPWSFVPDQPRRPAPALSSAEMAKLTGLDLDVMRAVAARLKRTPVVVPTDWYALEKDLLAGRFDVILSAWTPSPSTPATVVASAPYCAWGLVVSRARRRDPRPDTRGPRPTGTARGRHGRPRGQALAVRARQGAVRGADDGCDALRRSRRRATRRRGVRLALRPLARLRGAPTSRWSASRRSRSDIHVGVRKADAPSSSATRRRRSSAGGVGRARGDPHAVGRAMTRVEPLPGEGAELDAPPRGAPGFVRDRLDAPGLRTDGGRAASVRDALARCHGGDGRGGEMGPGIVSRLAARGDEELAALSATACPRAGMPGFPVPTRELRALVAFLRTLRPGRGARRAR